MFNPILAFSATRRMRSFRTLLIVAAYLGVMLGTVLLMMGSLFKDTVSIFALRTSVRAYVMLMIAQFALIVLIAPAMTSGAVAGERERQTLELLLVTNTRSFRIVAGKMMESFAMLALLIVSGFPAMCLTMIAGAVILPQILAGELFLLAMAFAAVCVGVLSSALARSTVGSSILSYVILLSIGLLTTLPLLADVGKELTGRVYDQAKYAAMAPEEAMGLLSPVLFINPGFALLALLQGQTGLLTSRLEYQDQGRILYYFSLMNKAGGQTVTLICCGAITLLAIALILIAALILRGTSLKPAKRTKVNA